VIEVTRPDDPTTTDENDEPPSAGAFLLAAITGFLTLVFGIAGLGQLMSSFGGGSSVFLELALVTGLVCAATIVGRLPRTRSRTAPREMPVVRIVSVRDPRER